jgi:ferrous iron transport protein B
MAIKVGLVGNPNVGKTSVFNYLTGSLFKVGNFPGVTVEKKEGTLSLENNEYSLVDLPGIYSLIARSPDEKIARDFIISEEQLDKIDIIVNVIDANNLARNLYLTTFLLEFKKPLIIILTMMDVAKVNGIDLDVARLEQNIGIPVIAMDPRLKKGKEHFFKALTTIQNPKIPEIFPSIIYETIKPLEDSVEKAVHTEKKYNTQFSVFKLLEGDEAIEKNFLKDPSTLPARNEVKEQLQKLFINDINLVFAQFRYNYIDSLLEGVKLSLAKKVTLTQKIDKVLLNKLWGFPLFVLIIWFCFKISIGVGEALQDFFDISFGALFVDYFGNFLVSHPLLKLILTDGIGSGLQAMTTFIPIVFMVFLFMNLLEDTGYLARVTVLVDRLMRLLGLPGKSLAPLIMGFGCNVTSIMGARILETPEERKIAIAMSPFISCSARLPVYAVISMALFPHSKGMVIFSLYFLGLAAAIFTAFFLNKIVFKSRSYSFLLLELPEYHIPNFRIIIASSFRSVKGLMKRGVLLIVYFTAFFQVLNHLTLDHVHEGILAEEKDKTVMKAFGEVMTVPLVYMGIEKNNWPAAVGIINGLLAKEAVVGSLVVSYATITSEKKALEAQQTEEPAKALPQSEALKALWGQFKDAVMTVPHNLIGTYDDEKREWQAGLLTDPGFYIPFYDFYHSKYEEDTTVAESVSVLPMIHEQFQDNNIKDPAKRTLKAQFAAYAFLIFILLYTGCVAVMAALKKELGTKWAVGIVLYQLFFSYFCAVAFFQIATAIFI